MVPFILSVCPLVWGWKALEGRSLMFSREHSCSQKTDMNRASLSEMMDRGNPWYLTIYRMNWSAVSTAVASFQVGMKWVILVARSVTVSTLSYTRQSRVIRGNPTIQSIPIACHFCTGRDTRSMRPRGLW